MTELLQRLSPRERVLVLVAFLFISSALVYGLVVDPLMSRQQHYRTMIKSTLDDLVEFRILTAQYLETESSLKDLERRVSTGKSGSSLLAAMEADARKLGLADRIASMKPFSNDLDSGMVQTSVEIRIEKINLRELVEFIEAVEKSGTMVKTGRLRVKTRFDDPEFLDATFLITALEVR
jgi:type II secretory pathway component PulM